MHVFIDYLNVTSNKNKLIRRLLTSLSQLLVVLIVWEFLRSASESPQNSDSLMIHISRRSSNFPDCFQKYSHGESLVLDTIITRSIELTPLGDKRSKYVLTADVLVQAAGSDSLIVYPEGTPVILGNSEFENRKQVWEMDYFEYNDDEIGNKVISNNLVDKTQSMASKLTPFVGFDRGLKESALRQGPESHSKLKLGYDSNGVAASATTQEAGQADPGVIDVMLIEDQMLKVRPEDQVQQEEILQVIKKRGDVRLLLQKSTRHLSNSIHRAVPSANQSTNKQNFSKEQYLKGTAIHAGEIRPDIEKNNLTQTTPLAWPEVVLDEASEPLYTEGFLERVQKVKSQLYSHAMFHNQRIKGQVRKYYLLNNPRLCIGKERADVVYLIYSQPQSRERRQRLRDTVVKSDRFQHFNIVHVFLVGKTTVPQYQNELRRESELYGDIVQGDFDDRLENSAWKGLMGMRWVLQFCRNVNFVFKINDNVFVDTDKLLSGLIPTSANVIGKRAMFCALDSDGSNKTSNLTIHYCDNFAVLMTRHLVCSILAASHQIRVPAVEDYYLYGILPYMIGGVEIYNLSSNLGFQKDGGSAFRCVRDQQDRCPIVAAQTLPGGFTSLWASTETKPRKKDEWLTLWNLQTVKSFFS